MKFQLLSTILSLLVLAIINVKVAEGAACPENVYDRTPTIADINNQLSRDFLIENEKRPDVTLLPSGLQYKIIRTGHGNYHPEIGASVDCHYRGTLIDGISIIDSTYELGLPTAIKPKQVIKGWAEAMQMMVEGDKWELYIPPWLAYGDAGSGGEFIQGGQALIFTVEMIEIHGTGSMNKLPDAFKARCNIDTKERCSKKEIRYLDIVRDNFFSFDHDNNLDVPAIDIEVRRIRNKSLHKKSDRGIDWCNRRIRILNQLRGGAKKEAGEEEEEFCEGYMFKGQCYDWSKQQRLSIPGEVKEKTWDQQIIEDSQPIMVEEETEITPPSKQSPSLVEEGRVVSGNSTFFVTKEHSVRLHPLPNTTDRRDEQVAKKSIEAQAEPYIEHVAYTDDGITSFIS